MTLIGIKVKILYRFIPSLLLMIFGFVPCTQAHLEAFAASAPVEIKVIARRFEFEPKTITVRNSQPVKL